MLQRLYKCKINVTIVIKDTPKKKNVQSDAGIDVHYITSAGVSLEIQQKGNKCDENIIYKRTTHSYAL